MTDLPASGADTRSEAAMAAAIAWHDRLGTDPSAAMHAAFRRWRDASPANAAAYDDVERIWSVTRSVSTTPPILALRHAALARLAVPGNLVPRRRALAAASIALVGAAAWLLPGLRQANQHPGAPPRVASATPPPTYQTGVGERLTLTLADGSLATLNTASRLRVAYSPRERRLLLEAGEAYFKVAKGQSRPFVVMAGGHAVTAHGTQFDVRLGTRAFSVALVEGRVSVARADAGHAAEASLKPSQMFVAADGRTAVRRLANVTEALGWRDGFVYFDQTDLADAAAEMNRYVDRPKIEVEPAIAKLKLSGAFRTGQSADLVAILQQGFPIAIVRRDAGRVLLGPARRNSEAGSSAGT